MHTDITFMTDTYTQQYTLRGMKIKCLLIIGSEVWITFTTKDFNREVVWFSGVQQLKRGFIFKYRRC